MTAEPMEIHIVSDSSGESAVRIARAAVAQFPGQGFRFVRHRRMTSPEAVHRTLSCLRERRGQPTFVLFTLVEDDMAAQVREICADLDIPCVDLMTDVLSAIERISGTRADAVPRRPVGVEADYFTRVAAMDYTVRTDDGAMPDALQHADIILVGASRSGKTPLAMYLGYLGYRTANIPLVPGIPLPEQLWAVQRWRIVGLMLDAELLQRIRNERVRSLVGFRRRDGYTDIVRIYDELDEVAALQATLGCPVVDTTGVALEESASRIIDIVERRAALMGASLRPPPGVATLDGPAPQE